MKVASWNVNSIKAREERLVNWLKKASPDVLCLQELKVTDDKFPTDLLASLGYTSAFRGQRAYNGVAILSRTPLERVQPGFGSDALDEDARLIRARVGGVTVLCAYVPNGQEIGSEKFDYKLAWLRGLKSFILSEFKPTDSVILCGDFNVALTDVDVAHPARYAGSVLTEARVRSTLQEILAWGFQDLFRKKHPGPGFYSWWDYRQLAFPKNDGARIDYVFATAPLAERCASAVIDRDERKGKLPSDHAPVVAEFT